MQIRRLVARSLGSGQNRLIATGVTAFLWLLLIVGADNYGNAATALIYGLPAVAVLFFWRRRPEIALGLCAVVLLLVSVSTEGYGIGGGFWALATGTFAVAGSVLAADNRIRLGGLGLVVLEFFLTVFRGTFFFSGVLLVLAGLAALLYRQFRQRTSLEDRLAETTERVDVAERDARIEIERNRIAREVHDVVAHSLAVVAAQADGARYAAETNPASVGPALEAIADTARRALGEVRTMLHDLKASGAGAVPPGADDITALVDGIRALDVPVDDVAFGEARALGPEQGLALYRVAQEALTNAMRHGDRGEPIGFELDWGEREVVLVVTNALPVEGVGASERAGHGIEGMRERAADAGGDCTAGVGSNGRFRVRVALPIAEAAVTEEAPPPNPLIALFGAGEPEPRRA